jgi:hypothetical protein
VENAKSRAELFITYLLWETVTIQAFDGDCPRRFAPNRVKEQPKRV